MNTFWRTDKAGEERTPIRRSMASAALSSQTFVRRIGPYLHLLLALWGLFTFWRLLNRSRIVPIALRVGPFREPLYPPWLQYCLEVCAVVVVWRLLALAWSFVRSLMAWRAKDALPPPSVKAPEAQPAETPGSTLTSLDAPPPSSPSVRERLTYQRISSFLGSLERVEPPTRPGWLELALPVLLTAVAWMVLEAFRLKQNPAGALVGMDSPTFLQDVVAILLERWDLYNTDKRIPYPAAAALVSALSGKTPLDAAQFVSFWSAALIVPLVYLTAVPMAGRLTGVLAALLYLFTPVLHPYAVQTTSYTFFYFVLNLTLAVAVWTPTVRHWSLFFATGLLAAFSIATQVKGLTVIAPVVMMVALLSLSRGPRQAVKPLLALTLPLLLYLLVTPQLPVQYTPLSWLVAHHREEVHQDMPYPWPEILTPPLDAPSRLSPYLPGFLRGGELEALSGVLLASPQSEVVVFRSHENEGRSWSSPELLRGTTLPPLEVRLSNNIRGLTQFIPDISVLLSMLLALGVAFALVPLPGGRLVSRIRVGWIIVAALMSVWGSLSLKFHIRYLLQALPAASILLVHGVTSSSRLFTGPMPRALTPLRALPPAFFVLTLSVSVLTHSSRIQWRPGQPVPNLVQALGVHDQENNVRQGVALLEVARWIHDKAPQQARIIDCSPMPVWLLLHTDPRFGKPEPEVTRYRTCQELIASPPSSGTVLTIVSDVSEYRGADTPSVASLLSQPERWSLVYGFNPESSEAYDGTGHFYPTHNAVLVFQSLPLSRTGP